MDSIINDTSSSIDGHYQKPHVPYCARCREPFGSHENMAQTGPEEFWHLRCFVCSHCFKPFDKTLEFYERFGRKYCRKDFVTLFAPCCAKCQRHITVGRFIKAMNKSWHPNCFLCDQCSIPLCDVGFVKQLAVATNNSNSNTDNNNNRNHLKERALCHGCNTQLKTATKRKPVCHKCKAFIEDNEGPALMYEEETYHAYHFNCHSCGIELKPDAVRQVNSDLYCRRCHDNTLEVPICGGCRRPIEAERCVTALGKRWHVEHFACAECERPFNGKRHFEVNGLAYCEQDCQRIYGHRCSACAKLIESDVISALDKYYCSEHFCCRFCSKRMTPNKTKFYDIQSEPCCKKCYKKFPADYRKQLAKQNKLERQLSVPVT